MQSFGAFLSDNKGWAAVAALLAVAVAIAILLLLYRVVFGHRLHMTGGRSRQPRLGVVDAFDLDRQRQLVLIRRDNVEHLLMIGGPNDLVIESAFIRAQPSVAVPAGRDKEVSASVAPLIPMPAPLPPAGGGEARSPFQTAVIEAPQAPPPATPPLDLTQPVSPKDLGPLSELPAPAPVQEAASAGSPEPPPAVSVPEKPSPPIETAQVAGAVAALPSVAIPALPPAPPTSRPPFSRLAQGLPPRPAGSVLPPRPPLSSLRTPAVVPGQAVPQPPRPAGSTLPNRPTPLVPLQRGTSAASLRRDTPPNDGPAEDPRPAQSAGAEPLSSAPANSPALPMPSGPSITLDSIESLEEEMAKLLGRAAGSDKK